MAVGPIGNAIYVNQQMAAVASEKNAVMNRFELQMAAAAGIAQESKKEVEEIRPAEESHSVDPDREHNRQQAEQEEERKKFDDEEKAEEASAPLHLLDIKV